MLGATLIASAPSSTANAKALEGTAVELEKWCNNVVVDQDYVNNVEFGVCIGYMRGFERGVEAALAAGQKPFCLPDKVTYGQMARVYLKFTDKHPELLHANGALVYILAMSKAFPCSDASR